MTDTPTATAVVVAPAAARLTFKDVVAIAAPCLALAVTLVGLLVGGGRMLGKVDDNTRRIVVLEQRADRRDDELRGVREKIAGIDAKLDLLIQRVPARH